LIIQWSTWEREEWQDSNGSYYQVNTSGIDRVPQEMQEKYRNYILGIDWESKTNQAHQKIWNFHNELLDLKIPHIFFNGNNHFGSIKNQFDWGKNYIAPYDPNGSFDAVLRSNGFGTVNSKSWHFGEKAHRFYAHFMLQYIVDNNIL
jgi:hypothetical protein